MLQLTQKRRCRRIGFVSSVLLLIFHATNSYAEVFVPPYSGALYIKCIGGSAAATSDFGTGTSQSTWVPFLRGLPQGCPSAEVFVANVTAGQPVPFAMHTHWDRREYWAFSTSKEKASVVAFSDGKKALKQGGRIIEQTSPTTWVMHLDDAASHRVDDNNADFLIQIRIERGPSDPVVSIDITLSFPTSDGSDATSPSAEIPPRSNFAETGDPD